jgi:hypothetical protein
MVDWLTSYYVEMAERVENGHKHTNTLSCAKNTKALLHATLMMAFF